MLRWEGERINHKRVQRVYRSAGLRVKQIRRKRLTRSYAVARRLNAPNQEWAIDFASDAAANGRRLRVLSAIDAFTRECLVLEVDTSLPSRRLTRALERVIQQRGAPQILRSDNAKTMRANVI